MPSNHSKRIASIWPPVVSVFVFLACYFSIGRLYCSAILFLHVIICSSSWHTMLRNFLSGQFSLRAQFCSQIAFPFSGAVKEDYSKLLKSAWGTCKVHHNSTNNNENSQFYYLSVVVPPSRSNAWIERNCFTASSQVIIYDRTIVELKHCSEPNDVHSKCTESESHSHRTKPTGVQWQKNP